MKLYFSENILSLIKYLEFSLKFSLIFLLCISLKLNSEKNNAQAAQSTDAWN